MRIRLNRLLFAIPGTLVAVILILSGCDRPLFTDLATNTLKVKIKFTYASNSAQPWSFPGVAAVADTDSVNDYPDVSADVEPTKFQMDIAEIRLNNDKFANYRQRVEVTLDDGLPTSISNGDDIILENDDVKPGKRYETVRLFIRKMIFNKAKRYRATESGWVTEDNEVIYFENDVVGFDFNQLQPNSYYDSLQEDEDSINRVFPLEIPIVGGLVFEKDVEQVLEIRIVVNNFINLYEYDDFDDDEFYIVHYYGLSDWLRDIKQDEYDIGGNVHAVARAYVPGQTGTVNVDVLGHAAGYIIAIPTDAGLGVTDCEFTPAVGNTRGDFAYDLPKDIDDDDFDPGDDYIVPKLDYYMKLEKYKIDWEATGLGGGVGNQADYENAWNDYDNPRDNFRIPPLAIYITGVDGLYTITNVPPGTYDLYYAAVPADMELFGSPSFSNASIGSVTVTAGSPANIDYH